MVATTKNPLCDFRTVNSPTAGIKATATTTAPTAATQPPNNNQQYYLVVQDVTASIASGTSNQAPVLVNLIDGTSGGTNILWSAYLSSGTSASAALAMSYLNIPCRSGFATLEFSTAGGTLASESVAMGGYYGGGIGGQ